MGTVPVLQSILFITTACIFVTQNDKLGRFLWYYNIRNPKTGKLTCKEDMTPSFPATHHPAVDYPKNGDIVSKYLTSSGVESRKILNSDTNNKPPEKVSEL